MRAWTAISLFYAFALWAHVGVSFLLLVAGGLQRANIAGFRQRFPSLGFVASFLETTQGNIWWVLPILVMAAGALGILRKQLGSPWLWDYAKYHLDTICSNAFTVQDDDAHHFHRVTLFKRVPWLWCLRRWPWDGWLYAVERSGHTSQNNIAYFRAPDHADNAEGVAGITWARNRPVHISGLPDLTDAPTEADFMLYAQKTGVDVARLKAKPPRSRSFYGIPLEVKGKLWGVLLLDSRNPTGIKQGDHMTLMFNPTCKLLQKLLERL